jgi:hypothetical protein
MTDRRHLVKTFSKKLLRKSVLETPEEILEDEIRMKFQARKNFVEETSPEKCA